jgi:hypothetical protein
VLTESAARCCQMLMEALVGPGMLVYTTTQDAHHHGRDCVLAHQLGIRLPAEGA